MSQQITGWAGICIDSHLLTSCRAASMLKMGDAEAAKIDCSRVLERVPNSAKALFRRAQAELALKVRAVPTHEALELTLKST